MSKRLVVTALAGLLACVGCGKEEKEGPERPPLRRPKSRLDREAEKEVMELLEDLRGDEYLGRVRAAEKLGKLAEGGEAAKIAGYVVQLTADPRLDVRIMALKLLMEHGRDCPEAVAALVEVLSDVRVNPGLRDGAARALSGWAGKSFDYRAWEDEAHVEAAAARWRKWLEETGGVVVRRGR